MKRFILHTFPNTTLLIAFALLVLSGKAFSETPINVQNSKNLTINHAIVDKSGASLLATNLGLYKYTNNQIYKIEEQSLSMIDNEPLWQVAQLENLLFLATSTQLVAYNTNTKKSHIVTPNRAFKLRVLAGKLYFISQEKLFYFDIEANKTELAFSDPNNKVTDYQVIKPNHYWLVSNERNLVHIINNNLTTNIPLKTKIQWLFLDRTNRLWITQDNQLYQLQNNNLKIVNALKDLPVELPISSSNAYFYFLSKGLLYRYQLDNEQTTYFKQNNLTAVTKLEKGIFLAQKNKDEWFQFSDYELNFFENVRLTPDSQLTNLAQYDKVVSHDESLFLLNDNAIWQFHIPSQRLKRLLDYTNLQNLYLQQPGIIWFSDTQNIYTFNLTTNQITTKFPFSDVVSLTGDDQQPPYIITSSGIYSNTGQANFEYLNGYKNLGKINGGIILKGKFYIISDTGFWSVTKRNKQTSLIKLLDAEFTQLSKSSHDKIWLKTPNINLLYDPSMQQANIVLVNRLISESKVDFVYQNSHYFITGNTLSTYTATSNQKTSELYGLSIASVQINTETIHFNNTNIQLPNDKSSLSISFFDNEMDANQIALNYRLSTDSPWIELPKGQTSITLVNLDKQTEKLFVYNRNGLIKTPLQISLTHNYFAINIWFVISLLLLAIALFLFFLFWLNHRKETQFGLTSALLAQTQEAIWISDSDLKVLKINKAFTTITGFNLSHVAGKQLKVFDRQKRNTKLEQIIIGAIKDSGFWSGEIWSKHKTGESIAISLNITQIKLPGLMGLQNTTHYVGMFKDITQLKKQEKQLRELATRDQVTQLLNRTIFIEQVKLAINACYRNQPEFCILFINLDNFYKVNDGLGHSYGNRVLKLVAERLEQSLSTGFTLSCLGGDEFGVLIPPHLFKPLNIFNIKKLCDKLLNELSRTITIDKMELCLTASIGSAIYPDNGFDCESIMRSADSALKHAKSSGKNNFQVFNHSIRTLSPASLTIENEINRAINNKEFVLFYQPKFNTQTNQICGVEALARWPSSNSEVRSPAQFISIAESNNAIVPLTRVLIEVCCQQIKNWQLAGVNLNGRVALNLSAIHFQRADLVEDLANYLSKYQITGDTMELEITEGVMMSDPEFALQQMHKLKRLGFTIALDDFGTGYSSLSYLKKFPIDRLKIDRSFVIDIEQSEQDRNITSTIIRLAKYLNIEVIAEGVETEAQAYFLNVMGCSVVQGYFFSKPLPTEQLEKFVEQAKVLAQQSN